MFVVGLTGGIGSGKSAVATLFANKGVRVINSDSLAREVVVAGSDAIMQIALHFGGDILDDAGNLKRSELRQIVFADEQERLWLETLLHPLIAKLMQNRIANCASSYCIIESPLLLETEQHKLVNRVLVVDVVEKTQLQRAMQRDHNDETTIRAIMATQMSRVDRLQYADDVIVNETGISALAAAVHALHNKYLALAAGNAQ
ncbi:MAG: dephospho-CoA kinase [Gammaproteobacteria bacterium]|nr:dephospho-CoA kinase [Gammaproteobacteria bacterium]